MRIKRKRSFSNNCFKISLEAVVFIGITWKAFTQGFVTFAQPTPLPGVDNLVYYQGVGLTGTQWVAELYAGTAANSLSAVTSSTSRFRSPLTALPGRWASTAIAGPNDFVPLPGINFGQAAYLQVKVWDLSQFSSFEQAVVGGGATGESVVFSYQVPPADDLNIVDYYMENLRSFSIKSCVTNNILVSLNGAVANANEYTFLDPVRIEVTGLCPNERLDYIFYTLDGTEPDPLTTLPYFGPVILKHSAQVRIKAYTCYSPNNCARFYAAGPIRIHVTLAFTLSSTLAFGSGGGSIEVNPLLTRYLPNQTVNVAAKPNDGWIFLGWSGDLNGYDLNKTIIMDRNKCISATFGTAVNIVVSGAGSVVMNPPGGVYPYGTQLRLYAVPQTNSFFFSWGGSGGFTPDNPQLIFVTDPNITVFSSFENLDPSHVSIGYVSDSDGDVTVAPAANQYTQGQTITITATPSSVDSRFTGWSGDLTGKQDQVSFILDKSKLVQAHFSRPPVLIDSPCYGGWSDNHYSFSLRGTWGNTYEVQSTTNFHDWMPAFDVWNRFGTTQLVDSDATNFSFRAYRAVTRP